MSAYLDKTSPKLMALVLPVRIRWKEKVEAKQPEDKVEIANLEDEAHYPEPNPCGAV